MSAQKFSAAFQASPNAAVRHLGATAYVLTRDIAKASADIVAHEESAAALRVERARMTADLVDIEQALSLLPYAVEPIVPEKIVLPVAEHVRHAVSHDGVYVRVDDVTAPAAP